MQFTSLKSKTSENFSFVGLHALASLHHHLGASE